MKNVLYYSDVCPDTADFISKLENKGINYESVNITQSMKNLKEFLYLRDHRQEFDSIKVKGQVGVPVLSTKDKLIFNLDNEWDGQ